MTNDLTIHIKKLFDMLKEEKPEAAMRNKAIDDAFANIEAMHLTMEYIGRLTKGPYLPSEYKDNENNSK